ncbi:hypothetical protein KUTeg_021314 [Tegillarca granosa]|uniref:Uncharacterized protein n=1 Tax=Tegillarca granosa TaxID=220873 RepID=A0ABQ9EEJ3_TEGGR|nr:hypothetical protein KUTeg_021314 [Tegillarca granosa]
MPCTSLQTDNILDDFDLDSFPLGQSRTVEVNVSLTNDLEDTVKFMVFLTDEKAPLHYRILKFEKLSGLSRNDNNFYVKLMLSVNARQTLPLIGGHDFKHSVLLTRFLKSVYNIIPPLPRYVATWDVSVLLRYLLKMYPLHQLDLKDLT